MKVRDVVDVLSLVNPDMEVFTVYDGFGCFYEPTIAKIDGNPSTGIYFCAPSALVKWRLGLKGEACPDDKRLTGAILWEVAE